MCADLGGSYSADKEPAMEETLSAGVDSNHYKVVRNWQMTSYADSDGLVLSDILLDYCLRNQYDPVMGEYTEVLDPDCIVPSTFQVNLSTFGTYVTMTLDESGSPLEIQTGIWTWANDEQTQFYVDDDWTGNISELSTTNWQFYEVHDTTDFRADYTFSAVP